VLTDQNAVGRFTGATIFRRGHGEPGIELCGDERGPVALHHGGSVGGQLQGAAAERQGTGEGAPVDGNAGVGTGHGRAGRFRAQVE
jgi:hypothetical protein